LILLRPGHPVRVPEDALREHPLERRVQGPRARPHRAVRQALDLLEDRVAVQLPSASASSTAWESGVSGSSSWAVRIGSGLRSLDGNCIDEPRLPAQGESRRSAIVEVAPVARRARCNERTGFACMMYMS
jgi:hypothetical protein